MLNLPCGHTALKFQLRIPHTRRRSRPGPRPGTARPPAPLPRVTERHSADRSETELKLGNVWVFAQLISGPGWSPNQLYKNPKIAAMMCEHATQGPTF